MASIESNTSTQQSEEVYLNSSKFDSCDDLLKSVREFYHSMGHRISILGSRKDKYVILKCDRGGSYRDIRSISTIRKKTTGSRLTECPFRVVGQKTSDGSWMFKVKDLTHNHEPSTDIVGHPSFRQLPEENIKIVEHMTKAGIPPRQILSSLRQQTPNLPAISRTIYNLKKKICKDNLGGRSMITALFEELVKGGFTYDISHNLEGRISRLFITHPLSIKLAKVLSNIFVMDCTYKTNKYKMPLLDIIGVSCFNTSFYSGFVFVEKEDEENYIWALSTFKKIIGQGNEPGVIMTDRGLALMNGIRDVFPKTTNLLCVWHIEKSVLANCKKYFGRVEEFDNFMSDWNTVVHSITEAIFKENWGQFELFYKEKKDALEYIKNIWLPWKEKFVRAWTDKYLHFGNRTSSRAEGAHAKLKQYLQVSTGDFYDVKEKIILAVEHEFNETKVKLSSEKLNLLHNCNMLFFRELHSHVSHFALKEIYKQYEKIKDDSMTPCTGHFMASMGLPCAHKMKFWQGTTLSLDLIHSQWRIDTLSLNPQDDLRDEGTDRLDELLNELRSTYQMWPLNKKEHALSVISKLVDQSDTIYEPVIQRPKGRPPKSKKKRGVTSTTRDPSRFELVESSQRHNSLNSNFVLQRNNEFNEENNLIDLNIYPSDDYTSLDLYD